MKKYLVLLLAVLMTCLCVCASAESVLPSNAKTIKDSAFEGDTSLTGLVVLPSTIRTIGARAFASTGLYALDIPSGCTSIGANAVASSGMTYVYVRGSGTTLASGALTGATYVFAPSGNTYAASLSNFVSTSNLVLSGNVYYKKNTSTSLHALCPQNPATLTSTLTIPKLVNGIPVTSLSGLKLTDCTKVTTLKIPSYLVAPSGTGKTIETYETMSLTMPMPNNSPAVGTASQFSVSVDGEYGAVTYKWTFTNGTVKTTDTTTVPYVTTTPTHTNFTIDVVAVDAVGDTASSGLTLVLPENNPVKYRALLIGNTYPGTINDLPGPDNDVAALKKTLSMWTGTPYTVTTRINVTASGIRSAITSAFSGADSNDVSLFFYSGHGTAAGDLCGTSNTYISVNQLRDYLDTIPGTKIVLLDSCYSGAHINKGDADASAAAFNNAVISAFSARSKANLATNGYIVLTASSKNQMSSSLSYDGSFWFGAFTYGVCYGSGYNMRYNTTNTAYADTNSDGAITLYECYQKAVNVVKNTFGCDQNIQYYGSSSFVLWKK